MGNIRLVNGLAVDEDETVFYFDGFARKTNDSFDQTRRSVVLLEGDFLGNFVFENDDVAPGNGVVKE